MNAFILLIIINILLSIVQVFSTIDLNLAELKYLAIHLEPYECRRLVAALHYTSYEIPRDIEGSMRTLDKNTPCLQHLIHWNNSPAEGRGKTHVDLEHRLRQLNQNDLADWLGKTVLKSLGKDLLKAIDKPFGDQEQIEAVAQYSTTDELIDEPEDSSSIWNTVDAFFMILFSFLIACLVILVMAMIINHCQRYFYRKKNQAKAVNICGPNTCIRRQAIQEEEKEQEDLDDEKKLLLDSSADAILPINTLDIDDQTDS